MKDLKSWIGRRVRVYGWVQMHHRPYQARTGGDGIIKFVDGNSLHVHFDNYDNPDEVHYVAHVKQCRLLRPKKKTTYQVLRQHLQASDKGSYEYIGKPPKPEDIVLVRIVSTNKLKDQGGE